MKLIIVLLLIGSSSCQLVSFKPKPIEIDGLGSLLSASQRNLSEAELIKTVKAATRPARANEEDAQALLRIYKKYPDFFSKGSFTANESETKITKSDTQKYLGLVLQHEKLREEAEKAIWEEATSKISESVPFSNGNGDLVAGSFIAVYLNAYFQTVAKDDEKLQDKKYDDGQKASPVAVVVAYEKSANEIVSGNREATDDQRTRAKDFLQALRVYNDKLPEQSKILNSDGRLISPAEATNDQRGNMGRAVFENGKLTEEMKPAFESLTQGITRNLKRQ